MSEIMSNKEREIFEREPEVATGVVIKNNRGEIFLGKSTKFGGLWIVPGGHLKYGEKLKDCVIREIREELGIELDEIDFLNIQESIRPSDYEDQEAHFGFINFTAKMANPKEELVLNKTEYSDCRFILPERALDKLALNDSTRSLIEDYLESTKRI